MKADQKPRDPNAPIRILHLHNWTDQGGLEVVFLNLVKNMDPQRFKHDIIFIAPRGEMSEQFEAAADRVVHLGNPHPDTLKSNLDMARRLLQDADVMNYYSPRMKLELGWLAMLAKKPAVYEAHVSINPEINGIKSMIVQKLLRRTTGIFADRMICCTEISKQDHVNKLGYSPESIDVITNGVDTQSFKPDAEQRAKMRRELGIFEDENAVILPARYDHNKGIRTAIEGLAKLNRMPGRVKTHLVLCGTHMDADNTELMEMIKTQGQQDAVHLLGYRSDMEKIYPAMDVVLLPSLNEALPLVVLEGMSAGCLPVTTRVGDLPKVLEPVKGTLIASKDPDALAKGLTEELDLPPEARAQKQTRMRQHIIDHYSLERMIREYEEMFAGVAAKHSRTSRQVARL